MSTPKKAIGAKKATPAKRTRKVSVPDHGRNRSAIEIMVASLREAGRLEPVDEARVIAACALADAVDADPTNASLWREYRAAVETLRQASDGGTDEFATLLAGLSAEVGDATNRRTGHPRS